MKRDDLVCFAGSGENSAAFAGNKARKLHHYLLNDFPGISTLVSYGSAQSNMLFSLSVLAKIKGWQLDFYVDHIASHLKENPGGNYAAALDNGACIHEVGDLVKDSDSASTENYVLNYVLAEKDHLYIPEGGHNEYAEPGLKVLASELVDWVQTNHIANPKLMLPSGTGTTALFLQRHLPFEVMTCACVGDAEYLRRQFSELDSDSQQYPKVLSLKNPDGSDRKFHFGKLYPEFYQIWDQVQQQTGITFELLYDPLGWLCMLEYLAGEESPVNIVYLHQGGLLGNETMSLRYLRKDL